MNKYNLKNTSDDLFLYIAIFVSIIGFIESMLTHFLPLIIYVIIIFITLLTLIIKKQI